MMFLVCALPVQKLQAQVVLSEVMFNPAGPEQTDEFIELVNLSLADTVNLSGWKIGDQASLDSLRFPEQDSLLLPGQYAVIFDPDYFEQSNSYDDWIAAGALILTIGDKTFGSGGLSNSRAETVILCNEAGDTVATYTYSPDNAGGYSDEKIDLSAGDHPDNWANSIRFGGTPGGKNSVSPLEFDVRLIAHQPFLSPAVPRAGEEATFRFRLLNRGRQPAADVQLLVHLAEATVTLQQNFPLLPAGFDTVVTLRWQPSSPGVYNLEAVILYAADENPGNNAIYTVFSVSWPRHAIVINEIMFKPATGQPEWIEILNLSSRPVSLAAWQVEDASGNRDRIDGQLQVQLAPGAFALISADRSVRDLYAVPDSIPVIELERFPALNNTAETVLLKDFAGTVIDSVVYQIRSGFMRNVSLERRREDRSSTDPANWLPSTDASGATPGRPNSVSPLFYDVAIQTDRFAHFPPKPARLDTVYFSLPVHNIGRKEIQIRRVLVGLDANNDGDIAAAEILDQVQPQHRLPPDSAIHLTLSWKAETSGFLRLQFRVDAEPDFRPENNRFERILPVGYRFGDLVINEIYARPLEGEPEWVEVYHRSSVGAELSGWGLSDGRATGTADSSIVVGPGEFVILQQAENSADVGLRYVTIAPWPSLNNQKDALILYDFYGRVIDSLTYVFPAQAEAGLSLERINPDLPSGDAANWNLCVDPAGSTPGRQNSIYTPLVPSQSRLNVSPNPFSPDSDGLEDFTIIQYELPMTVSQVRLTVYDLRGRPIRRLLNNAASGSRRSVIWDGRTDDGRILEMGIYIIYLEAVEATTGRLEKVYQTVVLARK